MCSNVPYVFHILVLVHHCLDVGGKVQVCRGICQNNSFLLFGLQILKNSNYCKDCATGQVSSSLFQQRQNPYCCFSSHFATVVTPANPETPIFSRKRGRTQSLVALVFGFLLHKPWMLWVDCWKFYWYQHVPIANHDKKEVWKQASTNPVQSARDFVLFDCLVSLEISFFVPSRVWYLLASLAIQNLAPGTCWFVVCKFNLASRCLLLLAVALGQQFELWENRYNQKISTDLQYSPVPYPQMPLAA